MSNIEYPTPHEYPTISPFRFWCQKVMPLVYDDSLSYYELLCKVVEKLNAVSVDLNNMGEDIVTLYNFTSNYFKNLDVQKEINNKLDSMASDGTLNDIIAKYCDPILNEQNNKIDLLEKRMDSFTSLENGSTTGDAELIDGRIGYNGVVYPNIGDAIRTQIKNVNDKCDSIEYKVDDQYNIENVLYIDTFEKKYMNPNGSTGESTKSLLLPMLEFSNNKAVILFNKNVKFIRCVYFNDSNSALNEMTDFKDIGATNILTINNESKKNATKFVLQIQKSDLSDWTDGEISTLRCTVFRQNELYYNFLNAFLKTTTGINTRDKAKAYIIDNSERGGYDGGGNPIDANLRVRTLLLESKNFLCSSLIVSYSKGFTVRYYNGDKEYVSGIDTPTTEEKIDLSNKYFALSFILSEENNYSDIFSIECNLLGDNYNKINVTWENGTCYANGENANSNTSIRSSKFNTKSGYLYTVSFPIELSSKLNFMSWSGRRNNTDAVSHPFSFIGDGTFARLILRYGDGTTDFTIDMVDLNKIEIHEIKINENNEISLSTTESTCSGDIVLNKYKVQPQIQAIISCINDSICLKLMDGDYYFDTIYTTAQSNQKSYIMTYEYTYRYSEKRTIRLIGNKSAKRSDIKGRTRLFISGVIPSNENDLSFLLVPRTTVDPMSTRLNNTMMSINDIALIADAYTKNFIFVNLSASMANEIENVEVRGNGTTTGLTTFPTKPNENCVGIRVGYGSNNGVQNYVKHCMVYFCGKGFSCSGEHYIFEDDLAHHCYYGFSFGDYQARVGYEHPNIMLGCSIEGSYQLMLLTKNGIMTEGDFVFDYDDNRIRSTLICIGLSTETSWSIPLDERSDGSETTALTKPILEILKGAYNGRVELDYPAIPFDGESCKRMKYIAYGNTVYSN